ncbi:hypothetical protein [Dysgonomonas termitidis]|uniref:Uncharacterized protein n=1 Tax=Dysgonomonas termitidis TaxID=1516126 RepID=A0ABV9KWA2_9BACT
MKRLLSLSFFFFILSFIQVFSQKDMKIYFEAKCHVVLNEYKNKFDCDSSIISNFKADYTIDMSKIAQEKLFKKPPSEIIAFFNTDNGKKYRCYIKGYRNRNDLLLK